MYRNLTQRGHKQKKPRKHMPASQYYWSDKEKIEAVKLWLACGSNIAVCAALKIPTDTFQHWKHQDWFKRLVNDIRTEGTLKLNAKLKTIIDASMGVIQDRLENGDWIYDQKAGELRRKPVSMRDAQKVADSFLSHSKDIERNPPEEEKRTEDSLNKLAEAFAQFAKKTTKVEITDAVVQEVPYREAQQPLSIEMAQQEQEVLSTDNVQDMRDGWRQELEEDSYGTMGSNSKESSPTP